MKIIILLILSLGVNIFCLTQIGIAEQAPFPYHDVTPSELVNINAPSFGLTDKGEVLDIEIPAASSIEVKFKNFNLGRTGRLTIISMQDRDSQTFTQQQLEEWDGLTGAFNGNHIQISLITSPKEKQTTYFEIEKLIASDYLSEAPEEDFHGFPLRTRSSQESRCGSSDDRERSSDPRVGRLSPFGCSAWIIGDNEFLTAGHCIFPNTDFLEFNVPSSLDDGTVVHPEIKDQYRINQSSIVFEDDGPFLFGNDWAIFSVFRNTETNLLPINAQGGTKYNLSESLNPNEVRITGFGLDDGPDNEVQQTHSGRLLRIEGDNSAYAEYLVDTRGGNSGSPIIALDDNGNDTNTAIGIHTDAGCTSSGDSSGNLGTSFRNNQLWEAIQDKLT